MIYFDNAATTFPKPRCVLRACYDCLKKYCGNPGRGSHKLSVISSEEVYLAREAVASFFGVDDAEKVVFTYNATYALNMAIKTTVADGSTVITSDIEHNAVARPLFKLKAKKGVSAVEFDSDKDILAEIEKLSDLNPSCIISNVTSNVTGKTVDLKDLSAAKEKTKAPLILDASQAAGHIRINAKETPFDVLCAPAHKSLFGIQGCGFAIFADKRERESFIEGGSGYESVSAEMPKNLPEHFEAGTCAVASIVALRHGIEFINQIGIGEIESKLSELRIKAVEIITSIKNLKAISDGNGIVSFYSDNIPSHVISNELDKNGICTRSGLHCAPSVHKKLGTLNGGTVRLSFSYLNSLSELDVFFGKMKEIARKLF
jgi:selenocysteine lyase/cysteine desulfurase